MFVIGSLDYESRAENPVQLHLRVVDRFGQEVDKFLHVQVRKSCVV